MSDDSYMYVFPMENGRFGVENRSASAQYRRDPKKPRGYSGRVFDSIQEAMDYAHLEASGVNDDMGQGCEYGVSVSPKLDVKVTYALASLDGEKP